MSVHVVICSSLIFLAMKNCLTFRVDAPLRRSNIHDDIEYWSEAEADCEAEAETDGECEAEAEVLAKQKPNAKPRVALVSKEQKPKATPKVAFVQKKPKPNVALRPKARQDEPSLMPIGPQEPMPKKHLGER